MCNNYTYLVATLSDLLWAINAGIGYVIDDDENALLED